MDEALTTTDETPERGKSPICRFYARPALGCEIGSTYLSSSDVETVVRYCSGDFTRCRRYSLHAAKWSGAAREPSDKPAPSGDRTLFADRRGTSVEREILQHEFRTPLAAILTCSEILRKDPDRPREVRTRFVNIINEEASRLTRTMEAFFDSASEVEELRKPASLRPEPDPTPEIRRELPPKRENTTRRSKTMEKKGWYRGWSVVLAGTGINLALGILYAWSILKGEIVKSAQTGGDFAWDLSSVNDPYALCCLVFAFAMIAAGKCQDRIGPRVTAMIGGLLVGAGFLTISVSSSYWMWLLGFGVLAGTGIGFGYSSATPPAIKWFPPAKTGLIAGIVVSGFGLAPVYIAPLTKYLIGAIGFNQTMFVYGMAFTVIVTSLSVMLMNPEKPILTIAPAAQAGVAAAKPNDVGPSGMLKSWKFYGLWTTFFVGSGAGLMVIGSVAGMAKASMGEYAFVAVAVMAVGNALGRVVAGMLSDRIGRLNTLLIMLTFQAALMFASVALVGSKGTGPVLLVGLATLIGFNYGTNLSLFPSLAKDFWGLKNFGLNYGILFTSWGVGGFVMGRLSQMFETSTGSFTLSFVTAGASLLVGAAIIMAMQIAAKRAARTLALAGEEAKAA